MAWDPFADVAKAAQGVARDVDRAGKDLARSATQTVKDIEREAEKFASSAAPIIKAAEQVATDVGMVITLAKDATVAVLQEVRDNPNGVLSAVQMLAGGGGGMGGTGVAQLPPQGFFDKLKAWLSGVFA